jgi:hypothetical protein
MKQAQSRVLADATHIAEISALLHIRRQETPTSACLSMAKSRSKRS